MKVHTWELIRRLYSLSSLPWVIRGDFNEILRPEQKLAGFPQNVEMKENFQDVL